MTIDALAPPSLPTAAELVAEHATGWQRTTVHRVPDGSFLWWHRPGVRRRGPLAMPAANLPAVQPAVGAAHLALPTAVGDGLLYRAHGPRSAAGWLGDPRPVVGALVADALASAGRALRAMHQLSPPTPAVPDGPPGPARLRSWLTEAALRSAAATRLLAHLRSSWGGRRIDTVVDWSRRLRDTSADATAPAPRLLHGGASLAALVPPVTRGRPGALLTGEELSAGDPEADLGWLVGELAEMRWNGRRTGLDRLVPHDYTALQRVLLDAYGPEHDGPAVARAAVLRVVTHLHDFAAYMDWTDELLAYSAFAAELIDSEGANALPGAAG
ncbi:hypothetical protein ACWEQ8_13555 [Streptomyces noursei]